MLYLLDANCLILAKNTFYPVSSVPEFWDWLVLQGLKGRVKIPVEIYEEFSETTRKDGIPDELANWAKKRDVKEALMLDESLDIDLVRQATNTYAPDLTEEENIRLGRDPFIIAYTLAAPAERTLITSESHSKIKQRANKKIPQVCDELELRHDTLFHVIKELGFTTNRYDWA